MMTETKESRGSRRLRRFFSSVGLSTRGQTIDLPESETRHLRNTLRLKPGDRCLVADSSGNQAEASIQSFAGEKTRLVVEKLIPSSRSSLNIIVYLALTQKGKMDYLIEKAQELEVAEIIPLETERTVVKMSAENSEKVVSRWKKIAREAVKQSGASPMRIHPPMDFRLSVDSISADSLRVMFHPENALPFGDWITSLESSEEDLQKRGCHLFFGPEGGFGSKEVEYFRSSNGKIVGLGKAILKTDTAFVGTLAALKFLFL